MPAARRHASVRHARAIWPHRAWHPVPCRRLAGVLTLIRQGAFRAGGGGRDAGAGAGRRRPRGAPRGRAGPGAGDIL